MGLNFYSTTIVNSNNFSAVNTNIDGVKKDVVKIKRDFTFVKDCITAVRKKLAEDVVYCKATIDFSALINALKPATGTNYCKLDIYVEYEGSEPFYGANPTNIRKGIPFWVEFSVKSTDTAASLAESLAKTIKKDQVFLIDSNIVDAEVSGNTLVLTGKGEFMRFKNIEIELYDDVNATTNVVASLGETGITLNARGKNSFGTYSQIVKDLRLPTVENTRWTALHSDEAPVIGAKYNQFIVEYSAPAVNHGLQAVGERMISNTTHVFWVRQDLSDAFEALFTDVEDVDAWFEAIVNPTENTGDELNN